MEVRLTKLSDERHRMSVVREDGTSEQRELDSRSFLRHDLAHYAVESALGLERGYWGSVAAGAPLDGLGLEGGDITLAESLAGQVQTLMRTEATVDAFVDAVRRVAPQRDAEVDGARIHELVRQLRGRWRATPYGTDLVLTWPAERTPR